VTVYRAWEAKLTINGKGVPIWTDITYGETDKDVWKEWKEKLLPKNPDEEVARLLPDVDPKKKLEDEGTNVP
jgi:hypothetical protein